MDNAWSMGKTRRYRCDLLARQGLAAEGSRYGEPRSNRPGTGHEGLTVLNNDGYLGRGRSPGVDNIYSVLTVQRHAVT